MLAVVGVALWLVRQRTARRRVRAVLAPRAGRQGRAQDPVLARQHRHVGAGRRAVPLGHRPDLADLRRRQLQRWQRRPTRADRRAPLGTAPRRGTWQHRSLRFVIPAPLVLIAVGWAIPLLGLSLLAFLVLDGLIGLARASG